MNQKGASVLAVVAAMLILGVMGVTLISLVTTGSDVSINQLQSEKAFNIAAGGIEYTLGKSKSNIPNYSTNGAWIDLGDGDFKVDTSAYLVSPVAILDTTISVDSTDSFPATGRIAIDDEFIQYTAKDDGADTFTVNPATGTHTVNNSVYPAARLGAPGLGNNCTSPVNINVSDDTGGFDIGHSFFIDTEYFYCTAKTANQFQNCTRCYAGSSPEAHPANNSYASQYILSSTGRITNIISNNAQRIVRVSAGPKEE